MLLNRRLHWQTVRILSTLSLLLASTVAAQSQPRTLTLASNPPGTVFYALASGLAKFASEGAPFQMVVQPYSGTSTFLPLLDTGEIDFGVNNAVDMALSYQGPERLKIGGRNPFQHTPNVRLIMRGSVLMTALLVRKDSPIKTIHDIRGKRLTGEYPAQLANWYNLFGFLTGAGMKWEDVKIVPVPAVNEGIDALIQGRADVAYPQSIRPRSRRRMPPSESGTSPWTVPGKGRSVCAARCRVIIRTG
jgi:TRAP-type uncharacterized transport system substrate-binding protein